MLRIKENSLTSYEDIALGRISPAQKPRKVFETLQFLVIFDKYKTTVQVTFLSLQNLFNCIVWTFPFLNYSSVCINIFVILVLW